MTEEVAKKLRTLSALPTLVWSPASPSSSLQPPMTPVLGDLKPCFGLFGRQYSCGAHTNKAYVWAHIHAHAHARMSAQTKFKDIFPSMHNPTKIPHLPYRKCCKKLIVSHSFVFLVQCMHISYITMKQFPGTKLFWILWYFASLWGILLLLQFCHDVLIVPWLIIKWFWQFNCFHWYTLSI